LTGDSLLVEKLARPLATAHVIGCVVSESFDSRPILNCYRTDVERSRRKVKKRETTVEAKG